MTNTIWEPVKGGHVVTNPARMSKLVVDHDDDAILWFLGDGLTLGGVRLRPDERLCRCVPVEEPVRDGSAMNYYGEANPESPYSTALPDRTGYWYRLYVEPTTGNWIDVVESVTVVDSSGKAVLEWRDSVGNLKFTELTESHDCYWARVVMPPWPIADMDETYLGPIEDMEQL